VATPVFRSASSITTANGTSAVINKPAGAAVGDILIVSFAFNSVHTSNAITPPAGFTLLGSRSANSTNTSQNTYYRVVDGSEGSTFTWATATNAHMAITMAAYSGADTVAPIGNNNIANSVASTTVGYGALSANTAAGIVILTTAMRNATSSTTTISAAGSGQTVRQDVCSTTSAFMESSIIEGAVVAAGGTPTINSSTASTSSQSATVSFVLQGISLTSPTRSHTTDTLKRKTTTLTHTTDTKASRVMSTLVDNFNDNSFNTALWTRYTTGRVLEQNQRIEMTTLTAGDYYDITSISTFHLTGSAAWSELVNAGNQSLTSLEAYPVLLKSGGLNVNTLFWVVTNNLVKAYKRVASTNTSLYSATYDPNVHKWFRIRESGGTTFWDTSVDGITWTNRFSVANPIDLTDLSFSLSLGTAAELSTSFAYFDNVNSLRQTLTHTTDTYKRSAFFRAHTTDTLLRKVNTRSHTTDVNKRAVLTKSHTTDTLKRLSAIRTHSTDVLKRKATLRSHTTDTNKRKVTTKTHTTDVLKLARLLRTHTTDTLKRATSVRSHTTDVYRRAGPQRLHTTDVLKRKLTLKTHTTDTLKRKANTRTHTTDTNKRKVTTRSHTTDIYKRPVSTVLDTFGKKTDGTSNNTSSVDNKRASQATPRIGGYVQTLTSNVWLSTTGSTVARGFIYADDGTGAPGALLAITDEVTVTNTTEQAIVFPFSAGNIIHVNGGTPYWIGVHWKDPGALNFTISRNAKPLSNYTLPQSYVGGTTDPFGAGSVATGQIDAYVTLLQDSVGSWLSKIQAWIYPGAPADWAQEEYVDGRKISMLKPEYYKLASDGSLIQTTVALEGVNGYTAANALDILAYSDKAYYTVSGALTGVNALMVDSAMQATNISTLVSFCQSIGFDGLELDFEGYASWSTGVYAGYLTFVTNLGNALHAVGLKLMIDGPAIENSTFQAFFKWKYEDFDSLPVDYICVLAYDKQWDDGGGTSLAPDAWTVNVVNWVKGKITDDNRIVVGIPAHAYYATTGGFDIVYQTHDQMKARTGYSTATRNADSEMLFVSGGVSNIYNDIVSINQQRALVESLGIVNVSVWHLGGNDWFSDLLEPAETHLLAHTTDTLKRKATLKTHTTDTLKRSGGTRTHSTDVLKRKGVTKVHTTDVLKRKATTLSHTTDTLKRAGGSRFHTTDVFKRNQLLRSHTTDTYKRKAVLKTYTTDVLKRKATLKSHTTDVFKRRVLTRSHTTDTYKARRFTRSHTTSTYLRSRPYSRAVPKMVMKPIKVHLDGARPKVHTTVDPVKVHLSG